MGARRGGQHEQKTTAPIDGGTAPYGRRSVRGGQQKLKITAIETDRLKNPPGSPYYDAIHELGVENGSSCCASAPKPASQDGRPGPPQ
ncbi:hypothetical protein SBA6_880001 [Candidatus Sulfopaludibacter sp. SbA6]|nr:hypothetical protein SBA6_880001 [Candidatus Sulfopaludibacter sp. SbA6]